MGRAAERVDELREAEVGDLHVVSWTDEHVGRLEVTVNDTLGMGRREAVEHLDQDPRPGDPGAGRGAVIAQVGAFDQLHHENRAFHQVDELDDVGVLQSRDGGCLAHEHVAQPVRQVVMRDFGRHHLSGGMVTRPVDVSHPARPDELEKLVAGAVGRHPLLGCMLRSRDSTHVAGTDWSHPLEHTTWGSGAPPRY